MADKTNINELKSQIKNGRVKRLYLFHGPEEYLQKYYINAIEKAIIPEHVKMLNKVVLEGKADQDAIINNCETLPVFSDRKLVIVKNSGLFKASKKQEDVPKQGKDLIEYLDSLPAYVCLIFWENEVDKRMKRLINVVNKNGLEVEFPYEKPENLVKWAVKVMKAGGKDIDLNAAAMLVNYCEPGMTDILSELEKLKDFLGEKAKATVADVEAVCTKTVKGRVFDITDAIAENNCTKAFKLLNDMLTLREPAQKIYFMIARQLRQVFQAKLLSGRGMGTDEVAKEMGLHPFIAGKVLKQASRFTLAKLKEIIKAAHEMDVAVKTGKMGELTAIEILIIRMSE